MNIYMAGSAGMSGAVDIYKENKKIVDERFPAFFAERIAQMENETAFESDIKEILSTTNAEKNICYVSDENELDLAKCEDCIYICTIDHGGIFNALWTGCEKLKCGCEVFLEKIPVRQEAIEVCELFGENPYEADSSGSLLIFSKDDLCFYENNRAPVRFIGRTTLKNERVILYKGNKRFLTPPVRQAKDIYARKKDRG